MTILCAIVDVRGHSRVVEGASGDGEEVWDEDDLDMLVRHGELCEVGEVLGGCRRGEIEFAGDGYDG